MSSNRDRVLMLLTILQDSSRAPMGITLEYLQDRLKSQFGMLVDRRVIYRDIDAIREYTPLSVVYDAKSRAYKVSTKDQMGLEGAEILDRAMFAARFMSSKRKEQLSKDLRNVAGTRNHQSMDVYRGNLLGNENEDDLTEKMQGIFQAIKTNTKICFNYGKYTADKHFTLIRTSCVVSPSVDIWFRDHYYLLGSFDDQRIAHYRMDRIRDLRVLTEPRLPICKILGHRRGFDVSAYLQKMVGLSSGQETSVELRVKHEIMPDVVDDLGTGFKTRRVDQESVVVVARLVVNDKLIEWILRFGSAVEVLEPKSLRKDVSEALQKAWSIYHTV